MNLFLKLTTTLLILGLASCIQPNKMKLKNNCKEGEVLEDKECVSESSKRKLIPEEESFQCIGSIPQNAILCPNGNSDLSSNKSIKLTSICSSIKCEYKCNENYIYSVANQRCDLRPPKNPPVYTCQGEIPKNAELCSGDNLSLTSNTDISLTLACSNSNKCEYKCNQNSFYDQGQSSCKSCTIEEKTLEITLEYDSSQMVGFTGYELHSSSNVDGAKVFQSTFIGTPVNAVAIIPQYKAEVLLNNNICQVTYYYLRAVGLDDTKSPFSSPYCFGNGCE